MTLNWRLALTALAIIPGIMLISFVFATPRPAHLPLGPQGRGAYRRPRRRNVLGIRVVGPSAVRCASCSITCAGGTRCCARSCSRSGARWCIWTSWGLLMGVVNVVIVWYGGYLHIARRRLHRRHHGLPVVHVPAAEPGLEHRQFLLRAAAFARGHGARVRNPGDEGRQARPPGRP